MPTALERLGLSPEDIGQAPAAAAAPQAPSQALGALGLTPQDVGQPQAAVPGQRVVQQGAQPVPEELGLLESAAQGLGQGVTFGTTDELYGIAAGLIPGGQNREEATKAARARLARANPAAMLAGELVGSVAMPGGVAATGAKLGARALRGALAGAATGGAGAAGRAEGGLAERAQAAKSGAALGGVLGGGVAAAAPAISRGVQGLTGLRRAGQPHTRDVEGLVETLARGDDIGDGAQRAIRGVQEAAAGKKGAVTAAYDKIATFEGKVEDKAAFELLANKFNRVIDEEGVEFLQGGDRIANLADRVIGTMEKGATPRDMDNARKLIAKVGRNVTASNPEEARIFGALKNEFDDWTFDTLTNKLYRGDEDAVKQIKEARGLATEYHKLFGKKTGQSGSAERTAGGMISRIIQDDVEAGEAINLIFGVNALGIKGSRQALARIRDASPEAFEELQSAHFMKLVTGDSGGDFLTADKIASRIQKLNTTPLAKTLYGEALPSINVFGSKLQARPNVAQAVADFVRTRPMLLGAFLGVGGAAGAGAASGGDPVSTATGGFAALLANSLAKGKGGASLSRLRKAARPDVATSRRAGQIGGTVGAIYGPSLAGG